MTVREVYEALLYEQNKEEAPSILRDKFVYLLNKAVNNYCNVKYNFYSMKQQLDDDMEFMLNYLAVDLSNVDFTVGLTQQVSTSEGLLEVIPTEEGLTVQLPDNYRHLTKLSIKMFYEVSEEACISETNNIRLTASRRLTPDMEGSIEVTDNAYFKASSKNVYHYFRASDSSKSPKLIIKYGGNGNGYKPQSLGIDYLRTLPKLMLTAEQLESEEDISDELPFNDRIAYEVVNILTALAFENTEDARLQSHMPINKTINEGPLK